jgi:hypothetical protein
LRLKQLHEDNIELMHTNRRKDVAFLRRCKKPRVREELERRLRESVTASIEDEAELHSLRKELKFRLGYYLDQSAIHAGVECRYLCEQMRRKLPRELRDMVYGYIIGCRSVLVLPRSMVPELHIELPQHPRFMEVFDSEEKHPVYWLGMETIATRHVFQRDFLGNKTFREFLEMFYEQANFMFTTPSLIPSFLVMDPWNFELRPKDHVRKVVLGISEASIRQSAIQLHHQRQNRRNWFRLSVGPSRAAVRVDTMLAEISLFSTLTEITIHVVPGIDIDRYFQVRLSQPVEPWDKIHASVEELLGGLKYISPALKNLKSRGHEVKICLESTAKCIVTEQNAVWSPLGWLERTMTWGLEERE